MLGCEPSGLRCDNATALGVLRSMQRTPEVAWCTLGALHALPAFDLVEMAAARLRYLASPSPPMPFGLHVGVIAAQPLAGSRSTPTVPTSFVVRLNACSAAERAYSALLRSVDRGDPAYHAFARDCASRVVPLNVSEIPASLQAEAACPVPGSLRAVPFQHGSKIFDRPEFRRESPPPPPWPMPQCDEELYTEEFLRDADAKIEELIEFENGRLARRPRRLYYGLEALQPHLRGWFAAGGSLDTSGGPGSFRPLSERPKYPTHWNCEWIERTLGHTTV